MSSSHCIRNQKAWIGCAIWRVSKSVYMSMDMSFRCFNSLESHMPHSWAPFPCGVCISNTGLTCLGTTRQVLSERVRVNLCCDSMWCLSLHICIDVTIRMCLLCGPKSHPCVPQSYRSDVDADSENIIMDVAMWHVHGFCLRHFCSAELDVSTSGHTQRPRVVFLLCLPPLVSLSHSQTRFSYLV